MLGLGVEMGFGGDRGRGSVRVAFRSSARHKINATARSVVTLRIRIGTWIMNTAT